MTAYNPGATASDESRSFSQHLARKLASVVVKLFRLNSGGYISTEVVQKIAPVCKIKTKYGDLLCRGGHGRLRWRAKTFFTEEPETIKWLESFKKDDTLWDIGANVGLYSIYAAKAAGCKVVSFEPEAQNYALLVENIFLNNVQGKVEPANVPVTSALGIGKLHVHSLTKGGAYNQFALGEQKATAGEKSGAPLIQLQIGASLDDLVTKFNFSCPTHIKIDVDGNEPEIIEGATKVLGNSNCKSVLIEIQRNLPEHMKIIKKLEGLGFSIISDRSNWESRENREGEKICPTTNLIFKKL